MSDLDQDKHITDRGAYLRCDTGISYARRHVIHRNVLGRVFSRS